MSLSWLHTVRHSGQVKRCHTVPTLQTYNVAEHSFNAIVIAQTICSELDYRMEHTIGATRTLVELSDSNITQYILLHDLAEGYTGDIPANVKKETAIKSILDEMESKWGEENVPTYMNVSLSQQEYVVAKLADTLELCMFCKDEITMGNRHPAMMQMALNVTTYATDWCRKNNVWPRISDAIIRETERYLTYESK